MLHAFHYEPQGQRQQFEPREAQENLKQRQMHLHFSLDLHLNLGARLRRAEHATIGHVTTIFAAFMGGACPGSESILDPGPRCPDASDARYTLQSGRASRLRGRAAWSGSCPAWWYPTGRFCLANEATQPHPFSSPDPRESASHRLLPAQRVHHASEQPASSILSHLAPPPLLRWNRGQHHRDQPRHSSSKDCRRVAPFGQSSQSGGGGGDGSDVHWGRSLGVRPGPGCARWGCHARPPAAPCLWYAPCCGGCAVGLDLSGATSRLSAASTQCFTRRGRFVWGVAGVQRLILSSTLPCGKGEACFPKILPGFRQAGRSSLTGRKRLPREIG